MQATMQKNKKMPLKRHHKRQATVLGLRIQTYQQAKTRTKKAWKSQSQRLQR
ncbi:hypothetical protein HMPREF0670_01505 [Prevotella sp. oral taxon 317 str. F0108]|nr:hypothetical protein HMPREF0670_01505 [Prevotella sp. oral taxon 317 str. F0108]